MPPASFRIFLAAEPIDFRKGMDGLAAHVASHFDLAPFDRAIYVLRSRSADKLKPWSGTAPARCRP
ncbi:IS66 family insertion sequence element accessory protein TnpB [Pseudogemmobacter sonorensis]|uniref:IS66 family insertion sequence element accessory protein TnpB n=1 Tax=Pseudogemmobacter sonorensis TaxID=2989681 RepID=UPI0036B331A9